MSTTNPTQAPASAATAAPAHAPATAMAPGSRWLGGEVPKTTARPLSDTTLPLVKKTDRAALNAKEQMTLRDRCIKGLEPKFKFLKPFDEHSSMEQLESVYSVTVRVSEFERSLKLLDMDDVLLGG